MRRDLRIVATFATLILASAGCGADPLPKSEFIERADAICSDARERLRELPRPTSVDEIDRFVGEATRLTTAALEDLRELEPPEADADTIERFLDAVQAGLDALPELADAARNEDNAAIQEASESVRAATDHSRSIAQQYGFRVCGTVDPTGT